MLERLSETDPAQPETHQDHFARVYFRPDLPPDSEVEPDIDDLYYLLDAKDIPLYEYERGDGMLLYWVNIARGQVVEFEELLADMGFWKVMSPSRTMELSGIDGSATGSLVGEIPIIPLT